MLHHLAGVIVQVANFSIIIVIHLTMATNIDESVHDILIIIASASSKGSGEPAHTRSLTKAFTVRIQ